MPNIDSGHYFLTALLPVMLRSEIATDGVISAPVNCLREALTLLRTQGQADPAECSPFARNALNHFARFVVIEDVNFNGRVSRNFIVEAVKGPDPSIPRHVDHLSRPYLLFAAEFDINKEGAAEPDVYLDTLWTTMQQELKEILRHCYGFSGVASAGDFVRYVKRCQVETTLPFCDYWTTPPPFKTFPFHEAANKCLAAGGGVIIVLFFLLAWVVSKLIAVPLAILAGVGFAAWLFVRMISKAAAQPFPTAPHSDLKSVLKALYLQRAFVDFAIASQGASPQALYDGFTAFLRDHRPDSITPTQSPGVVGV